MASVAGLIFSVKLSGGDASLSNGFLLLTIVAVHVEEPGLQTVPVVFLNTAIGTLIAMVIRAAIVYLEFDATQQ